jgi:glycine/D-amino acid oxidase-like deaminating enzyme
VRLIRDGNRVTGVEIDGDEAIHADHVVVAVGNWSREVMAMAGVELPMASTVGMVAVSGPTTARLRSVHHDDGMNIRPDGAGRVMMRDGDFDRMADLDAPDAPHPAWLGELVARVARVLPGIEQAGIETMRVTMRPIPGDGHPAVGAVPGVEGLYLLTSHSGVTLGPLLARLAADEIASGRIHDRLAPFRPDRLVTGMARG